MKRVFTALILLCFSLPLFAVDEGPLFSGVRVIEGLRCYPEISDPDRWYYLPTELEIVTNGGVPDFSLQVFRYTGRKTTDDRGTFWVRGFLSFSMRIATASESVRSAKLQLSRELRRQIELLPLPLESLQAQLVYQLAEAPEGEAESGALAGDSSIDAGVAADLWTGKTFTIGLDAYSASLLWQAYEGSGAVIAVSVSATAKGLPDRKQKGLPDPEPEVRTVLGDSIRIDVSPQRYPSLFEMLDINERMPAGYTFLDVYCYDFYESTPDDLTKTVVEIRGTAVTDEPVTERVTFSENESGYKRDIRFRFAMNLDAGYAFRITRFNQRGEARTEGWVQVDHWNGPCNASRDENEQRISAMRRLDPRDLYD